MKNLQMIKTAFASLVLVVASGCASLVTDSQTVINVQTSNGQKVKVSVDGMQFEAPGMILAHKNGQDKMLLTENSQCASSTVIPTKLEPSFWVDVILISPLSTTVDYATDKMWTYEEFVVLNCSGS